MVTVIAITAIVAATVAVFMRTPVVAYIDSVRHAELADAADTAVRRISRDLHLALPNSVRVNAGNTAVEFLLMRSGGRYRAEVTGAGAGNALDFNNNGNGNFDVIGPGVNIVAGDSIVVYNLGIAGADAYSGTNESRRLYSGATNTSATTLGYNSTTRFPFASPSHRFHVVEGPVSYVCDIGARTLTRHWGYGIAAAQAVPPAGGNAALLSNNVAACTITYDNNAARTGLVTINLQLSSAAANTVGNVNLYHAVHVSNVP